MRIKNHVPVVVTQDDVDKYGSVKSAVNGRVFEAEKVCNELNRILDKRTEAQPSQKAQASSRQGRKVQSSDRV